MTSLTQNTTAIILAGGAGTRLNGVDKGLQPYRGKALIERVVSSIEPQVNQVVLCANRNLDDYRALGFEVYADDHSDYQGPMAGICAALKAGVIKSQAEQILVSSCDVPYLPNNLRSKLQSGFDSTNKAHVSIAHDGNRRQNLHCLIRRPAWLSLIDFFDDGGRAMHRWFTLVETTEADFSDQTQAFLNINTIDQLR